MAEAMDAVDQAYVEAIAACGKVQDEKLRARLIGLIDGLHEEHRAQFASNEKTFTERVSVIQAELRHALDLKKETEETQTDIIEIECVDDALRVLWADSDGREIIARAYGADQARTHIELNYMGAHAIAGELRDATATATLPKKLRRRV